MFRDNFPRSREVTWKRLPVLLVFAGLGLAVAHGQNQPSQVEQPETPAPNAPKTMPGLDAPSVNGAGVDATYIIGPNDVLYISVFRDKDFTGLYNVRPDGMITLPLLRDMKATGLTTIQLTNQLTEALKSVMKDPDVTITVYDVRSKTYSITGMVKRTGTFPLIKKTTVFDAINAAGGFSDVFANQKDILIIRGDQRFHFNYADYVKGKNDKKNKNIEIESGDTISVK